MSGTALGRDDRGEGLAIAGILDEKGSFLREIELPSDIRPREQIAPVSSKRSMDRVFDRDYQRALELSEAHNADDGRVYLMRYATGAPVFAISETGEVKAIKVGAPDGAYLSSIAVSGGKLANMFVRKKIPGEAPIAEVIFSVIEVNTAQRTGEFYHRSASLGAAFACYRRGIFTFVKSDSGNQLQIIRAAPVQ